MIQIRRSLPWLLIAAGVFLFALVVLSFCFQIGYLRICTPSRSYQGQMWAGRFRLDLSGSDDKKQETGGQNEIELEFRFLQPVTDWQNNAHLAGMLLNPASYYGRTYSIDRWSRGNDRSCTVSVNVLHFALFLFGTGFVWLRFRAVRRDGGDYECRAGKLLDLSTRQKNVGNP